MSFLKLEELRFYSKVEFTQKLKIDYYEELVDHIHTKYPQVTIHGFSAIEIEYIARVSKISKLEVLKRLQAKGLSSIPGAGAEILSDRVRDIIAPKKMDTSEWLEVHRTCTLNWYENNCNNDVWYS